MTPNGKSVVRLVRENFHKFFYVGGGPIPKEKFALKVISTDCDEIGLQRIHEEIQIMKELGSHPGILELVDVDEVGMPGYIRFLIFKFHYLCLKS